MPASAHLADTFPGCFFSNPVWFRHMLCQELQCLQEAAGSHSIGTDVVGYVVPRTTSTIRKLVSPIFFSTDEAGHVAQGLGAIPEGRPVLFVGNHQLYALDTGIMIEELLREKGILLRGLAHPVVFQARRCPRLRNELVQAPPARVECNTFLLSVGAWVAQIHQCTRPVDQVFNRSVAQHALMILCCCMQGFSLQDSGKDQSNNNGFSTFMSTFGAVPVGGRNFYRLLQNKEAVLLYPGGVREVVDLQVSTAGLMLLPKCPFYTLQHSCASAASVLLLLPVLGQ